MLPRAQLRRYRGLRTDGVPASVAYRVATAPPLALRYRTGPGETITFESDDPELAAFTITAHTEPDPMPDISWLGAFTDTWSPEAIENSRERRVYRYFVPTYTVKQRRADFSACGYARTEAQRLAEHEARQDLRLAREIEHRMVVVSVRKAGVLLGTAVLGTDLDPDADLEEQVVAVIDDHQLIDEAVHEARATLPGLIAALAARPAQAPPTAWTGTDQTPPGRAAISKPSGRKLVMTSEKDRPGYLGEQAGEAAADYDRAEAESPSAEMATPVFDATVADVLTDTALSEEGEVDAEQAWVDLWYGDDPPEPDIDPETREGAAIMRLFRMIKNVEEDDGMNSWPGADVVDQLLAWFPSVGIDPAEHPMDAGQRLTLAARARPGQSLRAADYTVQIGTEHHDAEQILTTALEVMADQLGPGTGVHLHSTDGEIAHFERPATPLNNN